MKKSDGYATFTIFALILFIAVFITIISSFMFQNTKALSSLQKQAGQEAIFMEQAAKIIQSLLDDHSAEADSKFDSVWDSLDSDDLEIKMDELSSRLNPNFDDLSFWTETNLRTRTKSRISLEEWGTERINGFCATEEEFKDILFEEDWENLYTLYSFINANTAPYEVIESYLRQNSIGEDRISQILSQVRSKRNNNDFISQQNISGWMPTVNGSKAAVLNSQSKININFVDPLILEAILSYPWNGETVDNYLVMKNNILNARNTDEITAEELRGLMSCDEEIKDKILLYLGDTSWFWKLTLENGSHKMELILCRIPSIDDIPDYSGIQIANKRFLKKGDN